MIDLIRTISQIFDGLLLLATIVMVNMALFKYITG